MSQIIKVSFTDIIGRVHNVPSLPEVVTEVVRLINDPRSSAEQVHKIMVKDQAMAAKILRMVNSVYYGLPDPVHNLEQAIVILGFKTIRSIAMSIAVINLFQQQDANFNMKSFWTHSAVMAQISRLLAAKARLPDPEVAFITGLLKDIGMLIMVQHAPDETKRMIAVAREFRYDINRAARKVLTTDHAEVGAWLCKKWELPDHLVDAVRNQFSLDQAVDPKLTSVLQFGEYLCGLKKIRFAGQCGEPKIDQAVWGHLGIDKTSLVEVLSVINDEVDNAKMLLKMVM
ncbi:MAG: HDOD domain-containing protein [Planctomycetota bacterium]|nr:MAG: HDOD domain-containing protein [Planctomycetota bacterium]